MAKQPKYDDVLEGLLSTASPKVLVDLLLRLSASRLDVRRECLEYLSKHVQLSEQQIQTSEGEAVLALWWQLEPDLNDLNEYGGGEYRVQNRVSSLLYQIQEKLADEQVPSDYRHRLLDEMLPYIKSSNAGMDDVLYAVAYAACYDENDLRTLAKAFEAMGGEWQKDNAREIYHELGDRDKYLELRLNDMIYGGDYYDLATFYWDAGQKERAMQIAEEGMSKGQGRMDELHLFLAERAVDSGDRERYLEMQFALATDHLNLEKYKTFKKICSDAEWALFEARVLERLQNTWEREQLKIRLHRGEYEDALAILTRGRYPLRSWESDYEIQAAKELETRFPEEILKYYLSGLGNMTANAERREYARKARVMAKIHRVLVHILHDENRWQVLAKQIKRDNLRRPAFQEEFAQRIPGWQELT